jgi:monoamine oxidase
VRGYEPSRRAVLAGAAAAATAVKTAQASPSATTTDFDAVVIGGGLAGVTAARDLALNGFSTVLLEARDSLGGKTKSVTVSGKQVDAGGTWFHWHQSAIWREVQRYELEVVERPIPDAYLIGDGTALQTISAAQLDQRLRRGLSRFWDHPAYLRALQRPFAVQSNPAAFAEIDRISVEKRLRELDMDPLDDAALRSIFSDFGRPLDEISLAWALQRAANGVWSYEAFMALFAVYRLENGMASLVDAMVAEGEFEVRRSQMVVSVRSDEAGVEIATRQGVRVKASLAVLATPVETWKSLACSPPLPSAQLGLSQKGLGAPHLSNFIIHARGISGIVNSFAPYGSEPFDFAFTYEILNDDEQLISCYSMNGRVDPTMDRAAISEALRRIAPDAEILDIAGHDWARDPYALGGNGSLQPGQLTQIAGKFDRPVGRLLFAGADIAPQFPGFLTGAVESGARAARRASQILRQVT